MTTPTLIPARFGRSGSKVHLATADLSETGAVVLTTTVPVCGTYTRPGSGVPALGAEVTCTRCAEQDRRLPDDVDADAFDAYVTGVVGRLDYFDSLDDAVAEFRDAFVGPMTLVEYAEQLADEFIGRDSGMARDYFDAERYARDLRMSGQYSEVNGYVFSHA